MSIFTHKKLLFAATHKTYMSVAMCNIMISLHTTPLLRVAHEVFVCAAVTSTCLDGATSSQSILKLSSLLLSQAGDLAVARYECVGPKLFRERPFSGRNIAVTNLSRLVAG